jgi:hypothetical protein
MTDGGYASVNEVPIPLKNPHQLGIEKAVATCRLYNTQCI